jgi:hypothetical protein
VASHIARLPNRQGSVVVHVPHSSTIVPEDLRHTFVLGDLELDRDRGPKYALASAISGIP